MRMRGAALTLGSCTLLGQLAAARGLGLPDPVAPLTRQINDLHLATLRVVIGGLVLVIAVMAFIVVRYRKADREQGDEAFHGGRLARWSWVAVPVVMLGVDLSVAHQGSTLLKQIDATSDADVTVKITGSQWYWSYDYTNDDIHFTSKVQERGSSDSGYLRRVDQPLVLPVGRRIRLLHTATDVIHSWWVPQVAVKKDAIPGHINESWTFIERAGDYYGQCAQLCGTGHSAMPIHVKAVLPASYAQWLGRMQAERDAERARLNKTWSREDLLAKGETIFLTYCATCHKKGGEGNPPFRPALKGSRIATGPVSKHLERVIFGARGTDMAAWGERLSDADIAAVITYERNAWGNNMNDLVQPADVKAARAVEPNE